MSIVELRIEQTTPALIGYHTPEIIDNLYFLRPTSLKGIWRWVARALVAGVLYDRGLIIGRSDRDYVKIPKREEAEAISYIVGRELGLGYAGEKEESIASAFRIVVSIDRKPRITAIDSYQASQRRLQRLILLTLGRRRNVECFENGAFIVRLIITKAMDRERIELAIRTLILALTIMGIGKGSRRGLGSFDIVDIQGLRVERSFREFMEATYRLAERIILASPAIQKLREGSRGLPPMPAISKSICSIHSGDVNISRRVTTIYVLSDVNWVNVHNIFLRSVRSRRGVDILTQRREAWIFGLPRSQEKMGTGYIVKNVDRRASPILVSVHNRHIFNDMKRGVVVTFLTSADWPKSMRWVGASTMQITVDEALIVNAMTDAETFLLNFFGKQNLAPIWP